MKQQKNHRQSKINEIDVTQPGVINIDDEPYFVDGVVAKFILELLDEIDLHKNQMIELEKYIGKHGES
tara:strand:- start:11574 stop:11777 length:204 start_codon:yes stop_codon:yes gene_type:complete